MEKGKKTKRKKRVKFYFIYFITQCKVGVSRLFENLRTFEIIFW